MQKEILIAIVLGILVLVAFVQAMQLNSLNANLSSAKSLAGASLSSAQPSAQTVQAPQPPVQQQMVGGC